MKLNLKKVRKEKLYFFLKCLLATKLFLIISMLVFFNYYKDRKISHYNSLYYSKNLEIREIEKLFSKYYHSYNNFNFKEVNSELINSDKNNYKIKKFQTDLYFAKKIGKSSAYIDLDENNLYLATASGIFFQIDRKDLNKKKIYPKKLKTNINDFIKTDEFYLKSDFGIKDILIDENNILVSFNNEVTKGCFNTGILKAKLNDNYLMFENFFNHQECKSKLKSKYGTFSVGQAGGRIIKYNNNYLLSHGSYSEFDEVQDDKSIYGKIILISDDGKYLKNYSKGHRNPQGLALLYNKKLLSTEHGPNGGDEINLVLEDKNYGWPIASYGSHYKGQKHVNKYYPLPRNHKNFEKPIFYFKKSIAISHIISITKKFDNSKQDKIFLASMKVNNDYGEKINLFKFTLNNNKLILEEKIPINERIRDLIYDQKNNQIIMFLDTSASLAILKTDTLIN